MTATDYKINELFEELVPASGPAETEAGEIVRAICRIAYRNYNDGDHIGVGYGKETCNPAARFLMAHGTPEIRKLVQDLWGTHSDDLYDAGLQVLEQFVIAHLEQHPELRDKQRSEEIWDYYISSEDQDKDEEEEDW